MRILRLLPATGARHQMRGRYRAGVRIIQSNYTSERIFCHPLIRSKCRGTMRIIHFMEDQEMIKTILSHLVLWLIQSNPNLLQPVEMHFFAKIFLTGPKGYATEFHNAKRGFIR